MFPFFSDSLRGSKGTGNIFLHSAALGYDSAVPLTRSKEYTRVASVREVMEELVKLFRKLKRRFYWFDFTVRGQRYRGSTGETKAVKATNVASMKLAQALEHGDLFPTRPTVLAEFSERFLDSLDAARLEEKTKKFYRNGCRLLKMTAIFSARNTSSFGKSATVRAALDYRAPIDTTETKGAAERTCGTFHATPENDDAATLLRTSVIRD